MGYRGFKIVKQAGTNTYGRGPAFAGGDEWSGPVGEEALDTVTKYHWNTYGNVLERLRLWQAWQDNTRIHAWLDVVATLNASRMCRASRPARGASFAAYCHRSKCHTSRGKHGIGT